MAWEQATCQMCRLRDCSDLKSRTHPDIFSPPSNDCRRYPPQVFGQGEVEEAEPEQSGFVCVWPSTFAHEWCGEHQPYAGAPN